MVSNYGSNAAQSIQSQSKSMLLKDNNLFAEFVSKISVLIRGNFKFPDFVLLSARVIGILKIFAWSIPRGLPVLAILGGRYIHKCIHLKLWGWSAILTLFIYLFVPFDQGHGWGFRYFHSAWLALPLISTAYITSQQFGEVIHGKKIICIASLLSLTLCTGLRFFQVHQFIGQQLSQLPILEKSKRYVCILQTQKGYYMDDSVQNDPFLREPTIMLRSYTYHDDRKMVKELFPNAINTISSSQYMVWETGKYFYKDLTQ